MRSERKRRRTFLARFMVLFMIINLLSGVNPSVVRADETIDLQHFGNNGKEVEHNGITLKETASNYSNGEFDVDLLIKSNGKTTTTQDKMDVVLVIDRSGSMSENGKMQNTKTAAKNFVKALLKNENVSVGLVSFAGRHRFTSGRGPMLDHLPISRNEQLLTDEIDGYEPYNSAFGMSRNGTFTQAGLKKANDLFTDAGRKKAIILITDGEPTYAYKTEPNFNGIIDFDDVKDNSIIKYTHQVWSIGIDKDGRRDPNNKNMKLGNVQGKYTTGSGKNKKDWTYKPYYVELITNYTDYVGDGSNLAEDVRVATLSEAGRLKKSGVDIFSIGIGVNGTGRDVLHDIASPNKYYDSNMSANDLNNVLSGLEHVFKEYGIDGGTLKIAMNKQVSLISESVVIEGKNTSENATEGDKQELIKRVANIQSNLDQSKGEIVLNNLTLGKDEELHIKFRAKLAENWMDGVPYSINENAELTPKKNSGKINFNIPTVKDIKTVNLVIDKVWKGEKSDGAKFGLFIRKDGELERVTKDNEKIKDVSANEEGKIIFKDVDIAKYSAGDYVVRELNKEGKPVENTATIELNNTTPAGDSVVKKYQVTYDDDKRIITNTELIDITVKKTWADNVPQSERKSVEVGIYAGSERKRTVELKNGKWEDTVTDLPYLPDGYTVKEVEINGIEVNNDLKKLYKVEGEMEKIKETSTINITNSFNLSENKEGKINVLKRWTVEPKNIKVKLYRKTAATTTESSKWVEASTEELNGNTKVLKAAFDKVEGLEKYQILETAVGTDELTEDDIQNILSSKTESPIEYKIGEYEVTVHNLGNDTFFIKNTQDSTMKELVVEKKWSDNTLDKYKEAVQVQLYKVENNKLVPVEESRYLDSSNWKTKFKGLRIKDAEGKNIDYRVAEVVVGNTTKTNLTLEDLQKSYKIGSSTVTIDENDINTVVITNDVNLRDISVKKAWEGTATAGAVEITLYKKVGNKLEFVETKKLNSEGKWMTDFERQPKVDEEGVEIGYQIFETAIDGVKINIDPTAASGYKPDEQGNISYSTGTINDGSYSVVITGNSKDNNFVVKNSFTRNPVLPVIPGGDTPGGTPVIPVVTPDPIPTPTPNPSTPVVDVPNDPSPQGPATPVNDGDEDNGVTEIDEDDVPQGDGKEVKKDNKANKDTVDIADNKAPKGTPKLPKTGGEAGNFLSIIGLGLIGLGLVIRRRR